MNQTKVITTPYSTLIQRTMTKFRDKYRLLYIIMCYIILWSNLHLSLLKYYTVPFHYTINQPSTIDHLGQYWPLYHHWSRLICTKSTPNNKFCSFRIHHCVRKTEKYNIWLINHLNWIPISWSMLRSTTVLDLHIWIHLSPPALLLVCIAEACSHACRRLHPAS